MIKYNIDKHKNDIFAIENYGKNKKIFIKDVLDKDKLLEVLYEIDCQEMSLSKEGLDFLSEYYGLDVVSNMILEEIKKGVDFKYSREEQITAWLLREVK